MKGQLWFIICNPIIIMMFDLRDQKCYDLKDAKCLKFEKAYLFIEQISGKKLVAKIITEYDDHLQDDIFLKEEFKKLFLLSGEPEIGTVYHLAKCRMEKGNVRSCYVMNFIEGKSVDEILKTPDKISFEILLDIISQMSSGMEKAHAYEVTHGDFHEGNVMIDNFGFVKIIDFWYHIISPSFAVRVIDDITNFNKVLQALRSKCEVFDLPKYDLICSLCSEIITFNGLSKKINLLNDVLDEYFLLDKDGREIISKIIESLPFDFNLQNYLTDEGIDISDIRELEINFDEIEAMEKENNLAPGKLRLRSNDDRYHRINEYLAGVFHLKLNQLKLDSLIYYSLSIINVGVKFLGPYHLNYSIHLSPKLLKWKKINSEIHFLENVTDKDLTKMILDYTPHTYEDIASQK
jgi:hypothetical protein